MADSVIIPDVDNINVNMSLGSMLTHPTNEAFMVTYHPFATNISGFVFSGCLAPLPHTFI